MEEIWHFTEILHGEERKPRQLLLARYQGGWIKVWRPTDVAGILRLAELTQQTQTLH